MISSTEKAISEPGEAAREIAQEAVVQPAAPGDAMAETVITSRPGINFLHSCNVRLSHRGTESFSYLLIKGGHVQKFPLQCGIAVGFRTARGIGRSATANEQGDKKGMHEVLDNAQLYIADAERFLSQGKHELAVLSMGYAEGLIDALRFQKGINPWNL